MKRLFELTADDLLRTPVWRYVGQDDADARVDAASETSVLHTVAWPF